ncbi:MAG: hypothetical protein WA440_05590 [Ignavibacteriaceae bacterium]
MSAQTKTRAQKAGKYLGIALFAFLMFFSVKVSSISPGDDDFNLFGLKLSVFVPSAYASVWQEWKVTCKYNSSGTLIEKICENTSNKSCECP